MSEHHDIDQQVRRYMLVFGALLVGTVLTVAASYLDLPHGLGITLALVIATAKGSLVALYFMHLIDEKKLIYFVLVIAVLFFAFELFIPWITESNNLHMEG